MYEIESIIIGYEKIMIVFKLILRYYELLMTTNHHYQTPTNPMRVMRNWR